ncbi:hypothetical protein R1sor_023605 [Riccia sorocarpa]|uniref:BTB domain-containing protein n=1 Tax=Riccia sorocarpa TaxID=122646 RepID=A0ABD3GS89_9MARC
MNHHRQRRPQQRGVSVPQHEQERMQQVLQRLQSALQLGLKPTSTDKKGRKRWYNTDAEVQLQALRAISAFVSALMSYPGRPHSLQIPLEDSVASLEHLLRAETETVYSKAADVTAALVDVMGDGLLGYGGRRLVGPLADRLKSSKLSIAVSAATALHGILLKVKSWGGIKAAEDSTWKALEDADVLSVIRHSVQEDEEGNSNAAALLKLGAVVVEKWPESRYRLGRYSSLRTALLIRCQSSSNLVAQGALRTISALALCGCVASLLLYDADRLWSTVASCLHPTTDRRIQLEAFRLLTSLSRASSFGASFTGPHVAAIAAGCARALELGEGKGHPEVGSLTAEAAQATSSILSWPGSHYSSLLHCGLEEPLLAALSGARDKQNRRSDAHQEDHLADAVVNVNVDRRTHPRKLNPRIKPLLWEILGWLGAFHSADVEPALSHPKPGQLDDGLLTLACTSFLKALCKRGQSPVLSQLKRTQDVGTDHDGRSLEEQPFNAAEVVQISKAVLLLLCSPSPAVSSRTKVCLEEALSSHGRDWLPSLAKTTVLGLSRTVNIDQLQLLTNLLAVACLSWEEECRDELLKFGVLEAVLGIIQGQTETVDESKTGRLSAMAASVHSVGSRACCFDAISWEGNDSVLFAALWALPKLLQGSGWVKKMRDSMSSEVVEKYSKSDCGDFVYMLWKIAGDESRAAGVRWWSSCSLAAFGIFGFPGKVGQDFKRSLDDPSLADIMFVFSDGTRLPAHGIILSVRCQTLLPANVGVSSKTLHESSSQDSESQHSKGLDVDQSGSGFSSVPSEVHVSPRLTPSVIKILLEFIYVGVVYIPSALLAEIKVVAKRCRLEPLVGLLQGKSPVWGQRSAACDLEPALGEKGEFLADVLLLPVKSQDALRRKGETTVASDSLIAHRFILSARCQYFEALFRSGMRDSSRRVIEIQASKSSIQELLRYLYSGAMKSQGTTCAWMNLELEAQLEYLRSLLELVDLTGQWLLDELQHLACAFIGRYLESNPHLCPPIMSLAAAGQMWNIVELCATHMAPVYMELRDSGSLDILSEDLSEFVREAHVKLLLSGKLGDAPLG